MKKFLPSATRPAMRPATSEWLRMLIGGAAAGVLYLAVAVPCGLSEAASQTVEPIIGSIGGIVCGCIYLIVNALLLEMTVRSLVLRTHAQRFYRLSYIGRYLLAGVALTVGFVFLDPFAVFVVLISPKVTYLVSALAGIEMK